MDLYARAGDAMHVNNTRYMMASNAIERGLLDQARDWADECVAYAQAHSNQHELGHALLVSARARGELDADDLDEIISTFSAVGDLRCLARGYLLAAEHRPPPARVSALQAALDVARRAHDTAHQTLALEQIVSTHWAADDCVLAAVKWGELIELLGEAEARRRAPEGLIETEAEWHTAIAEGRARARSMTGS